ncbi:MAG: hypothetical protein IJ386_03340, partial [Clostridia bacterium]|nr:hypothetical protein [Clostridia bacterium]
EDNRYLNCLDKIGAAEYAKYAAGEDFDEYYGIRFTEYPDIAIIGQVVTEPGVDSVYDQRVMDSVIRNGERHYLTENKRGPGFCAYVTEDFVCITMAASGIGGAFYVYDGGAEHHCRNSLSTNDQQTEPWDNNGDFSIQDLSESNGIMYYFLYGENYAGSYMSGFRGIDYVYEGPDDMFSENGTVQLVDGKIKYVASETLTVAEWYKTQTGFHEESGCYTIEEFIEWLKTGAQWD